MSSNARYYVSLWLVAVVTATLVRRLFPTRWGIILSFTTPARGIPVNVLAFWLILLLAATLTILKLFSAVGRRSV
jgi:hypothetical protein